MSDNKPTWEFVVKPNGQIEVKGSNFQGSKCAEDIIYKLIHKSAIIDEENKHKNFGDEKPVENVYYIKGN